MPWQWNRGQKAENTVEVTKSGQVHFVYLVSNQNRSYLWALFMQSRSRLYSLIYRDSTFPPGQTVHDSSILAHRAKMCGSTYSHQLGIYRSFHFTYLACVLTEKPRALRGNAHRHKETDRTQMVRSAGQLLRRDSCSNFCYHFSKETYLSLITS